MLKIKNSIFKILIELFIFDKKKRSTIKAQWAKKNLKKYVDRAILDIEALENGKFNGEDEFQAFDGPKASEIGQGEEVIWQYWHQGKENAPDLIQRCFESVEKFEGGGDFDKNSAPNGKNSCGAASLGGRKIIVLSFDTIKDYIKIPEIYYELVKAGKIKIAHFSDIVRLYLLNRFGGLWVDSTILLTDKIPSGVWESDFSVFQKSPIADPQENRMTCYFIRAKKACRNTFGILRALNHYYKENDFILNYFMFEHISTMLFSHTPPNSKLKAEWENMPYLDADGAGKLQTVLLDEFNLDTFKEITDKNCIHKLSYKVLKDKPDENSYYNYIMAKGE